jgi:hypothetical protein
MRARAWIVAAVLAGGAANAVADEQHKEGAYGGVTPGQGSGAHDGGKHAKRPPPKDELTWIGFAAKDGGGGELFFQAPAAFTVSQSVVKGEVVLVLEGLHRQGRNLRRPLDTRYFDAPIARVTARPVGARGGHKSGIEVRIAFKTAKDAHEAAIRTATEADGMFYAYLDFGAAGSSMTVTPSEGEGSGTGADSADGADGKDN